MRSLCATYVAIASLHERAIERASWCMTSDRVKSRSERRHWLKVKALSGARNFTTVDRVWLAWHTSVKRLSLFCHGSSCTGFQLERVTQFTIDAGKAEHHADMLVGQVGGKCGKTCSPRKERSSAVYGLQTSAVGQDCRPYTRSLGSVLFCSLSCCGAVVVVGEGENSQRKLTGQVWER